MGVGQSIYPTIYARSLGTATTTRLEYETRKVCTVVPVAKPKGGLALMAICLGHARTPRASPISHPSYPSRPPTIHTCARRGGGESCLWCLVRFSLHSPTLPSSLRFDAAAPPQRTPPKEIVRRGLNPRA
eukprot:scaffold78276_cov65-Phaeocystis_antarctica.AAC.4